MGKLHILIAGVKASLELVLLDTGQSPEGGFCWQEEEEVKTREYAWLPVCHSHGYHLDDHISIGSRCGWRTRCQAWPCSLSPSPLLSPSLSLVSFVFRYILDNIPTSMSSNIPFSFMLIDSISSLIYLFTIYSSCTAVHSQRF